VGHDAWWLLHGLRGAPRTHEPACEAGQQLCWAAQPRPKRSAATALPLPRKIHTPAWWPGPLHSRRHHRPSCPPARWPPPVGRWVTGSPERTAGRWEPRRTDARSSISMRTHSHDSTLTTAAACCCAAGEDCLRRCSCCLHATRQAAPAEVSGEDRGAQAELRAAPRTPPSRAPRPRPCRYLPPLLRQVCGYRQVGHAGHAPLHLLCMQAGRAAVGGRVRCRCAAAPSQHRHRKRPCPPCSTASNRALLRTPHGAQDCPSKTLAPKGPNSSPVFANSLGNARAPKR